MPTFTPGEGLILVVLALGAVFWYFNKKSGGKLLTTAEADVTAMLQKTVAAQAQTIATLAPVVASAPVQAIVNAPVAAGSQSPPASVQPPSFTLAPLVWAPSQPLGAPMIVAPAGAPVPSANQTFPLDAGRKWYPSPGLRDSNGAAVNGYAVDDVPAISANVLPPDASKNQNGPGSPTADGRWYKFANGWWGNGYYVDPDPNQAAKDAAAQTASAATVADMVPGHWSQAHILAAILNSGGLAYGPGGPGTLVWTALHAATGEVVSSSGTMPRAAKCIADCQGSKFSSALANIRGGMTVQAAFDNQKKGVGGNYTDPDFTIDELTAAWALAQSYGVK